MSHGSFLTLKWNYMKLISRLLVKLCESNGFFLIELFSLFLNFIDIWCEILNFLFLKIFL